MMKYKCAICFADIIYEDSDITLAESICEKCIDEIKNVKVSWEEVTDDEN